MDHRPHLLAGFHRVGSTGDVERRLVERTDSAWASGSTGCSEIKPAAMASDSTADTSPRP